MDAVAAAALAAIVDHDCARVLQDVIAENAALRQQLQDFQAKLRGQADIIVKLRHTIDDLCEDSLGFIRILRSSSVLPPLQEYQALVPGYFRRLRDV